MAIPEGRFAIREGGRAREMGALGRSGAPVIDREGMPRKGRGSGAPPWGTAASAVGATEKREGKSRKFAQHSGPLLPASPRPPGEEGENRRRGLS
jgi:hypothetical protein